MDNIVQAEEIESIKEIYQTLLQRPAMYAEKGLLEIEIRKALLKRASQSFAINEVNQKKQSPLDTISMDENGWPFAPHFNESELVRIKNRAKEIEDWAFAQDFWQTIPMKPE